MGDTIDSLLKISHELGRDPMLVQAGGGNTSVKSLDRQTMFIKASGTPMARMTREQGWVQVSMEQVLSVFSEKTLASAPAAQREKTVLELLGKSVIAPMGVRPSVETPLHAVLDSVVMHSHPVYANAVTCNPNGREMVEKLSATEKNPALWVAYTDPGFTLASVMNSEIADYKRCFGQIPEAIFLENHGFFYSAGSVEACLAGHAGWMEKIRNLLGPLPCYHEKHVFHEPLKNDLDKALGEIWMADGTPDPVVSFLDGPEFRYAAGHSEIFKGALSPDHIVYTGPEALVLPENVCYDEIQAAAAAFRELYKLPPKLVLVQNQGLCVAGKNPVAAEAAEALALAAIRIFTLNSGNVRFMNKKHVDFILGWEAEHYRAGVLPGK